MSFRNHVAHNEKVMSNNPTGNVIAIILLSAMIIITPIVTLYVLMGDMFWRVLLLIGCCFIISPFFAIYGFARAATPVSPNQLLSMVLHSRRKEAARINETKIITRITPIDIIKGVLFSIFLVVLYDIFSWMYGSLFFLGKFLDAIGPAMKLIMTSA